VAAASSPSDTLKVAAKPAATPASASKKSPDKLEAKPDNKPPDTKSAAPSVIPPAATATAAPSPAPAPGAEAKVIVPAKATNAGTRSLVRSLGLKLHRVVIDAGHGGHDTGTIGAGGYTEKELVLDVAMRLKALIENEMGAEVVMTRSDDSFIPLESRTAI